MIGKLKMKCGAQFTAKLEGMINDMRQADEHMTLFAEYKREKQSEAEAKGEFDSKSNSNNILKKPEFAVKVNLINLIITHMITLIYFGSSV